MKIEDAFEPFFIWQEKMGMSKKTIENDRYYLEGAIAHSIQNIEVMNLKKTDVSKVIEAGRSRGKYGPQRGVVMLRKILRYLKESGHPIPFRWQDIRIPTVSQKQVEYLTEDELERVLGAIDLTTPSGLRTRTLLEVLYATGLRIGEAIAMDQADVDWKNKEAVVVNVKSKEPQKVFFTDRSLYWLKRYLKSRKDANPALFTSGDVRLLRKTSQSRMVERLRMVADSLGIKKRITHHLFRKTFVTHLLQRKADIMAVKDLARHRSERTTLQNYAGVDKQRSKAIHAGIMNDLLG
jgi:site-specific recombinase XerD